MTSMSYLEDALRKIEAQQPKDHTTVWCCGEQLKDILRAEPALSELVAQDLERKEMSITACEKKIKARADEIHKKSSGSCAAVSPMEAEEIIRKFYGLPARCEKPQKATPQEGMIKLVDFF